jgi:nucleotide-binding universal stress UspA family protein
MNNQSTSGEYRLMDLREDEELANTNRRLSIKRILVPTPLTSDGSKVIHYAVAFASRFEAEIILLHVYEARGSADLSLNMIDDTIVDEKREHAEDALRELCVEINEIYPHCDMCFRSGTASEEIMFAARDLDADMIVVSTHKHHWYRRLLDKSDAEKLLRHAPCPVLVVREDGGQH